MKKLIPPIVFLAVAAIISMQSCVKKSFDFDRISGDFYYDGCFAIPVAKASLTVRDILQDFDSTELFVEDATGFLYIMYHTHVFSLKAKELITIPDQDYPDETFYGAEYIAAGFTTTQTTTTISHAINHPFMMPGLELLDSVVINTADLNINVSSGFFHTGQLVVRFPYLKKNGLPYQKTIQITSSNGTFSTSLWYVDLNGYTLDLSYPSSNQLPVEYELTYTNSGGALNATDETVVDIRMQNLKYYRMYGYMGQDTMSISDTIKLEIFNSSFAGHAYFEDPKFNVFINNSYGIPVQLDFGDFETFTTAGNAITTFPFTTSAMYDPLNINYPSLSQIGQSVATNFTLTKANSEVVNIVNEAPKFIFFALDAYTNPNGNQVTNYITEDSQLDMDIEIELPMWGNASYFVLQDTTDLDFSDYIEDVDLVDNIKFVFNVENGMPADVGIQIYFVDSNYIPVDSAFTPSTMQIVESGVLDANGKVVQATHKRTEIVITHPRLENFEDVKYIFYRGYVYTTNNATELVRFYSNYAIDMKVGLQIKFDIEDEDL